MERSPRAAALELYAVNDGFAPVSLTVDLTKSKNTGFSPNVIGPHISHLIAPQSRKLITMAVPLKRGRAMEFSYSFHYTFGDNLSELKPVVYRLPIGDGSRAVIRTFGGLPFKTNFAASTNAVELVAPQGTPVVAARAGRVFFVREVKPGAPAAPSPVGDYVLILHDDGSWGVYGWLQPSSIKAKVGQDLKLGDVIAAVGANPDSYESFVYFGVVRNLSGTAVGSVPLRFSTAAVKELDPQTFSGPVSPDLPPKYPSAVASEPWQPSEDLLPTPPVRANYGDEDLSPLQRQSLYRQRILDHANAGRETVSDSGPLSLAIGVAVVLAVVGVGISLFSGMKTSGGGARGYLWGLIHGSPPRGINSLDFHDMSAADSLLEEPRPVHSHDPASDGASPSLDGPAEIAAEAPSSSSRVSQRLHDPATLELIRHVASSTPVGLISTHLVPAIAVVPAAGPGEMLDFVFVRATDGTVVLVLLSDARAHLAHTLSVAGIAHAVLPPDPSTEQVQAAVRTALA